MFFLYILCQLWSSCYGMESKQNQLISVSNELHKNLVACYIKTAFNVPTPEQFDVVNLVTTYDSSNLCGNIDTTIAVIRAQLEQKDYKNYYDGLKYSEQQIKYIVALGYFKKRVPVISAAIRMHCTVPICQDERKVLLEQLWYAHWGLLLPSSVAVQDSFDEPILRQFVTACQEAKKITYKEGEPVQKIFNRLKQRCNLLLAEEQSDQESSIQIGMRDDYNNIIKVLNELEAKYLSKKKSVYKNVRNPYSASPLALSTFIIAKLVFFWESYWAKADYSHEEKKLLIKDLFRELDRLLGGSY